MKLYKIGIIWLTALFINVSSLTIVDSTLEAACKSYLSQFNWGCYPKKPKKIGGSFTCFCKDDFWLQSMANCIYNATSEHHLVMKGYRDVSLRCQNVGIKISVNQLINYRTNVTQNLVPIKNGTTTKVNSTLLIDEKNFDWHHKKFKEYTIFVRNSQWCGWGLIFYWAVIISTATIININDKLIGWRPLTQIHSNLMKKYLTFPTLWNNSYHERTYMLWKIIPFNFPLRLNGIIITFFVILTIILGCIDYNVTLPHPYLSTQYYANLILVSFRTDMMSIALFPLIYIFGSRNNIFMPLSGLSFSNFQVYHKWCAYVSVTLAFIHTIVWSVWAFGAGGPYSAKYSHTYWKWGIAAIAIMITMLFQAEKIIRDLFYELFIFLHQLMALVFIVAMYYHLVTKGWIGWVYTMIAIYSFERLMRIIRIVLNGGLINVTLEQCSETVIKLIIPKPKYVNYPAGSFAFIYFIDPTSIWFYAFQSHPFTILKDYEDESDNLIIHFKVHKGITKVMLSQILKRAGSDGKYRCKILVEGPYGITFQRKIPIKKNVAGIAAGLGVCAIFPHMLQMIKLSTVEKQQFTYKLNWIVRDVNDITWFKKELLCFIKNGGQVNVFVTRSESYHNKNDVNFANDIEINKTSSLLSLNKTKEDIKVADYQIRDVGDDGIIIFHLTQRPDLNQMIEREIYESTEQENGLLFVACGPPAFNDSLRTVVANKLNKDLKIDVSYKSESFTW